MAQGLREGVIRVTKEIERGFQIVMIMYVITFCLGIDLVITAVMNSLLLGQNIVTALFGSAGLADLVALLVFKPTEKLQYSRRNLAQLEVAYVSWVNDLHNWNNYWTDVSAKEDAFDCLKEISRVMLDDTEKILKLIESGAPATGEAPTARENQVKGATVPSS